MGHHWREPYRPESMAKKPSVLSELVGLIVSAFRHDHIEKNRWAMPFSATPMVSGRRFAGRKH